MLLTPSTGLGRTFVCLIGAALTCSGLNRNLQAGDLTVNSSVQYQTIDGFGTAMMPTSQVWTPQYQDLYTQDLGASMLRVQLTADVLPLQVTLGPDVQSNVNLFNFGVYPMNHWGQFAQTATNNAVDQMKVIGTIFTPPAWMKTGGSQDGGSLIQTSDNLQQFARYAAAYVEGFQQTYGVPLYAISLQNELRFAEPYPSSVYTPDQYVATLKAVGAEFARDGITTKIYGPEDVGVDGGWITAQQMSFVNAVRADPIAAQYLSIYGIHGYAGNGINAASNSQNWADYYNQIKSDGLRTWMTEESGENPAWISTDPQTGQANGALSVALHVHQGLVYGNFNAWLYWQMDDGNSPTSQFTLTANADPTSLKYNAIKHYFRFIRPGDVRVDAGPDDPNGINIDAFLDPVRHSLVINLINMAATDTPTTIQIPGTDFSSFAQYRTSATEPWAVLPDVLASNGELSLTIPGQSIVTLVSDGVSVALPEPGSALLVMAGVGVLLRRRKPLT